MRKLLLAIALTVALCSNAYLAKWTVHPTQDSFGVKVDNQILVSDSIGFTILWDIEGNRIFKTENTILPYVEGFATVTKGDNVIVGVLDIDGKYTPLPNLNVAYSNPYFHDGYLICQDGNNYAYYTPDGNKAMLQLCIKSYPFTQGYAPFCTYGQFDKQKDPYYGYYMADGRDMTYMIVGEDNQRMIEPEDVDFLSAIAPDGRGVAVIKNKIYWFNTETGNFEPMIADGEDSEKKRHLQLNGNYEQYFLNLPTDSVVIEAKFGKKQYATLRFDAQLVPTVFTIDGIDHTFQAAAPQSYVYKSPLSVYQDGGAYGLEINQSKALPAQFEEVGLMYGNKAFVKTGGKWGIIEVMPDLDFTISINGDEKVPFRHRKYNTDIKIDLPVELSAAKVRLDIPESTGIILDKKTRESKDTEYGNEVRYKCTLNIPQSLPDTVTVVTYSPISVSNDQIAFFDKSVDVREWHYKSFNVDPIDSETMVHEGVASFTVDINIQSNVGDKDYSLDLRIEADSISANCEKITETRYRCTVYNLQDGINNLNIYVTEEGCPSAIFPFEIAYTKPAKKKKEEVVIRKKSAPAVKKEEDNQFIKMDL